MEYFLSKEVFVLYTVLVQQTSLSSGSIFYLLWYDYNLGGRGLNLENAESITKTILSAMKVYIPFTFHSTKAHKY